MASNWKKIRPTRRRKDHGVVAAQSHRRKLAYQQKNNIYHESVPGIADDPLGYQNAMVLMALQNA